MQDEFVPGRIVYSRKTKVLVMPHEGEGDDTFTGEDIRTGELSCMWEKKKFFRTERYEPEFYTLCAIHRMLDRGKIGKESAIRLLVDRAKVKPERTAIGTVELWIANPRKRFTQ